MESQQTAAIRVADGGDLQAALNRANPGDTILLAPGAVYRGTFVLPARRDAGDAFITIRTDGPGLPGPGERTGPAFAGRLAVIRGDGVATALRTAPGTHHWRIENVEFAANEKGEGEIIALGSGGREQRQLTDVPHDLVLDRVYIHGDPKVGQRRGIGLNSAATTIVNSYIADIKAAGIEAQAICGWNGPGPFVIENNYLEAAGENVMFGGSDPWIDGLVPTDITVRGNHFSRPVAWRAESWTVKNLFELKNARRVVIDGNLFEHHWPQAQAGYAIVFTPRNQQGRAPWSVVADVRFSNNVVRRVSSGINISGRDDIRDSQPASDFVIDNNLFLDVGGEWGRPGDFLQIGNGPANVRVTRNTVLQTGRALLVYGSRLGPEAAGFVFTGNVIRHNRYGLFGNSVGTGNPAIERYLPGAVVENNVFFGGERRLYPAGNRFEGADAFEGLIVEADGGYRLRDAGALGAGADLTALRTSGRVERAERRPSKD
ncbi:MAG: right-handed parallel beta-helix repeat-containing protein [Vicinamibacterales bacterium]